MRLRLFCIYGVGTKQTLCYMLGVMQWLNRNEISFDKSPIKSCTQIIYREHITSDIGHCCTRANKACMQIVDGVLNNVSYYVFYFFHCGVLNKLGAYLTFFRFISRINDAIFLVVNNNVSTDNKMLMTTLLISRCHTTTYTRCL